MRYLLLLCGLLLLTSCSTRVYEHRKIDSIVDGHTVIAVLPARVKYKSMRLELKDWTKVPSKEAIAAGIQKSLAYWVWKHQVRGVLDIKLLDIEATNKILAKSTTKDYGQLARELGVDAVLTSHLDYDTSYDYDTWRYRLSSQNPQSRIHLNLFTPEEGLVWSFERGASHPTNSYDRIVFDLLVNAARKMPYAVAK